MVLYSSSDWLDGKLLNEEHKITPEDRNAVLDDRLKHRFLPLIRRK